MDYMVDKLSHLCLRILDIVSYIINKCFACDIKLSENVTLRQFIRFGIVGITNTIISYLIYTGSLLMLRVLFNDMGYDYLMAGLIAFLVSASWSYYWNNKKVFNEKKQVCSISLKGLLKTYIAYSFSGLFLSSVLLYIWVNILGISEFFAPILNLCIHIPINFVINKFWTFSR